MTTDVAAHGAKLCLTFKNLDLLAEALTHRSYINENKGAKAHNERLEFLGDAVLELAVTHFLFNKYPTKPEGELTAFRASLVNTYSLADSAELIGLNDMLLLSKGESKDTGRARQIILANAFEALLGAIYLDQGYEAAEAFIAKNLYSKIEDVIAKRAWQDAKSRFQEVAQEKRSITPTYKIVREEGPDHNKQFTVGVHLGNEKIAEGMGASKQEAEQSAAQAALDKTGW
ncbi:ribonuclease III [Patescibacteria group bacterium]|nr:ribonuclease III [Patescibacteria group bacterium]MBU1755360.1 ribonuclease III [Patescibacteria group bacterium]